MLPDEKRRSGRKVSVQIHVLFDVIAQTQRVLANEPLCQLSVAPFQGTNNLGVIRHRTARPVHFRYRALADGAHVEEKAVGYGADEGAAADANDRLMETDVRIRVFPHMGRIASARNGSTSS